MPTLPTEAEIATAFLVSEDSRPPDDSQSLGTLESMTRNRDLWAKVAGERLGEIGRLKEKLDAMRRERNEALAEVTVARATAADDSTSAEVKRLESELENAITELGSAKCDRDEYLEARNDALIANQPLIEDLEKARKEVHGLAAELDSANARLRSHQDNLRYFSDKGDVLRGTIGTLTGERDRARCERDSAIVSRNIALASRDEAIRSRDRAIAERVEIGNAFERYVALIEDEEDEDDWEDLDDVTDEEIDAALDVTEAEFDEEDGGDPDSILCGELSGKIGVAFDRLDRLGNAIFDLGSKVDRQAGRVDAAVEAVRDLDRRFERLGESHGRLIAAAETSVKHLLVCVESLFAKFDHPKLVALLRPDAGEPLGC